MTYCDQYFNNPGLGGIADTVFRANSVYDPDYTGTGHQPLSHDQWGQLYHKFTVMGSKVRVFFQNSGDVLIAGDVRKNNMLCGINLTSTYPVYTTVNQAVEQPDSRYALLGAGNAANGVIVKHSFNAKRFFGIKDPQDGIQYSEIDQAAAATQAAFFHVWFGPTDLAQDPSGGQFVIVIEYDVLCTDKKKLAQS